MSKGGMFLLEKAEPGQVFTPEDFTEEHRMIGSLAADFVANEISAKMAALEAQEPGLMVELLKKSGELGLLSAEVPEDFGGMELDKISSLLIGENLAAGGSFVISHGAHTGIGTLPIVYFGNEQQKSKYLPLLATGEKLAAYALTEPGSGSDALAAKTKAVLSDDGTHYILNGTKQFITNAGFADVFIVYAKVDGDKFSAFIVEKDFEGVFTGPEEKKMGLKGSSTCSLILDHARVPAENLLGEIGRGHVVAFNILNIGRFKLAAGCLGAAKLAIDLAAKYSLERIQFGVPIARFGLIQEKLARMAAATYAVESMVYRTGGMLDKVLKGLEPAAQAKGIEEYAVECSINKVYSSEVLDQVADEALQIFGGYGYSQEYPVELIYRDSRINRIFEGTNEINRLLIPGTLLRRAIKGQLPLIQAAQQVAKELVGVQAGSPAGEGPLAKQAEAVEAAKKVFLMAAGVAAQKYLDQMEREQEILALLANMIIEIYALESGLLRAEKEIRLKGEEGAGLKILLVQSLVNDSMPKFENWAKEVLAAVSSGDELRTQLAGLRKLLRYQPINGIQVRRLIADRVLAAEGYTC
ncbi:MAG: acyl-CoA dehydrogenase family protein [Bacillota bacterium]